MSTRDEIEAAIAKFGDANFWFGNTTNTRDSVKYADQIKETRANLMALIAAAIAPPAPGEVRLTLERDDAEWWRDVIDKADCWGSEHEAARVLDVLTTALAAAAAPGEQ